MKKEVLKKDDKNKIEEEILRNLSLCCFDLEKVVLGVREDLKKTEEYFNK